MRVRLEDRAHLPKHPPYVPQEGLRVCFKAVEVNPFDEFHKSKVALHFIDCAHGDEFAIEGRHQSRVLDALMPGLQIFCYFVLLFHECKGTFLAADFEHELLLLLSGDQDVHIASFSLQPFL